MKRVLVLLAICGCTKHPAIPAAITGATLGFGTCMVDNGGAQTCGLIGGGAALFLGGIAAIVSLVADTGDHTLTREEQTPPEPEIIRKPHHAQPVPEAAAPTAVPVDAGVPDAPADAAPADAM